MCLKSLFLPDSKWLIRYLLSFGADIEVLAPPKIRDAFWDELVLLEETPLPDANSAARFLRSRRSVRSFQQKHVPRETVRELLDIARFAPTACNSQGVSYHVVDDPVTIKAIAAVIADWAEGDSNIVQRRAINLCYSFSGFLKTKASQVRYSLDIRSILLNE